MAPAHILRLPLNGNPGGHVLVRVVPNSSHASHPLDLELTATEAEQAYVRIRGLGRSGLVGRPPARPDTRSTRSLTRPDLNLTWGPVSRYRDRNSSLSDDEWEQCLSSLLRPGTLSVADLDVTAKLKDEETLTINIRKKVSGHSEPVGALTLTASESATENIELFDWCNDAVEVRGQLEKELVELKRKHADLERLVADETAHFKELERSKNEFEAEHDSFLRDLLNEKKLKIRTQAKVLSTAQVDEDKLAAVSAKAKGSKTKAASKRGGAPGASSKGKRKADEAATPDEESDDEAAADMMDIDPKPKSPEQDLEEKELSDAGRTTEGSETASEPEAEPEAEPEPKKAGRSSARKKGARASPSPPAKMSKRSDKPPSSNLRGKSPAAADKNNDEYVPPPRALPFKKKPTPAPVPADDDSTASEASEL
ncbi:hypothetical protein VM1G_09278 [Cytospora mali]|uniref:DNA repair protein XRCC4 n=1 Tax=Cytospora mali TaxID=578113 RepID=A0A194WAX4_CYTMA|nr:hypothetical protein VM1G_09278 [Valsa mali]